MNLEDGTSLFINIYKDDLHQVRNLAVSLESGLSVVMSKQ